MTTNVMFVADLHLHPDAERVPIMTPDEYDALVLDVEARGVVTPLDILADGTILDGRHRWQVARNLGLKSVPVRIVAPDDPVGYMVRAAVLRRHLTTAQRKALAASLLTAEPSKSDRAVAKAVGLSPTTVGTVRAEAEEAGDVSRLDTRTDTLGRAQPASKPGPVTRAHHIAAEAAGVPVAMIQQAEMVADLAPDLMPAVRDGALSLDDAVGRVRTRDSSPGPGATLIPPATKEPRIATWKDQILVPRMLGNARVLARVRPESIAACTPHKDRPKMAVRIREMIVVLEAVAKAMDDGADR